MTCSCCGEERPPGALTGLRCRDEIWVCRDCIGWLRAAAGVPDSTPILPVGAISAAQAFYESAGFEVRAYDGGGFAFVSLEGESVFDLDEADGFDPAANRAGCYLIVAGVDAWHARLVELGAPVSELVDQPWGMREFTLTDPDGNHVRIGRSIDS